MENHHSRRSRLKRVSCFALSRHRPHQRCQARRCRTVAASSALAPIPTNEAASTDGPLSYHAVHKRQSAPFARSSGQGGGRTHEPAGIYRAVLAAGCGEEDCSYAAGNVADPLIKASDGDRSGTAVANDPDIDKWTTATARRARSRPSRALTQPQKETVARAAFASNQLPGCSHAPAPALAAACCVI
jgi:hypothetical protein